MSAVGVRVCPVCGEYFRGRREGAVYCSAACRNLGEKPRAKQGPVSTTGRFTDDAFRAAWKAERERLNAAPQHEGDRFWGVAFVRPGE